MRTKREIEILLDDYFHNRIPAGYLEEAIRILAETPENIDIDQLMRDHWSEKSTRKMPNENEFNVLLDNIHHQINLIEEHKIRTLPGKGEVRGKYRNVFRILTKVAAVLFIPLLLSSLFYFTKQLNRNEETKRISYSEIYTPMAAKTKFLLPDSSIVWLNSGSSLKYPTSFTGKTREVSLTGEGYFEVSENPELPFVVKTAKMNVTALGTSFNLMAYPDDQEVKATLVTGGVKVDKISTGTSLNLKPSSQVVLDTKTGKMLVSQVDTCFYISWKDGKLIFRNEPLEDVAHKLERWFNCKIYIEDSRLKNFRYTGNIEMETLREMLELINITTPVKSTYNQETREIWLEPR
jgi:transmembrane sensor